MRCRCLIEAMQCHPISAGARLQQCLTTLHPPRIGSCRSVGSADHRLFGALQEPDRLNSRRLGSPAPSRRGLVRRHPFVRPWVPDLTAPWGTSSNDHVGVYKNKLPSNLLSLPSTLASNRQTLKGRRTGRSCTVFTMTIVLTIARASELRRRLPSERMARESAEPWNRELQGIGTRCSPKRDLFHSKQSSFTSPAPNLSSHFVHP